MTMSTLRVAPLRERGRHHVLGSRPLAARTVSSGDLGLQRLRLAGPADLPAAM